MRIGEAINLTDEDVDFTRGTLLVRKAKFSKSRMIPLHPTTVKIASQAYKSRRAEYLNGARRSLLRLVKGNALSHAEIYAVSSSSAQSCWSREGVWPLSAYARLSAPVCGANHDQLVRGGKDVERLLPVSSTFLGHVCVASTYWYLTEQPELMKLAVSKVNERWEDGDGK